MKPFRILLVTTQMEAGGAQKALLELAAGLRECGHDISVWTLYDKADYVPEFSSQYGFSIVDLRMKVPGKRPVGQIIPFIRGMWRAFREMRAHRFEVLQSFQHYSNILMAPLAWLAGIPVRVTSQRTSLRDAPPWLFALDRLVNNSPLVNEMTSVSEATRQFCIEAEGIRADKLTTIWNGIDTTPFAPEDASARRQALRGELGFDDSNYLVTTIGRLAEQKGHRYLIEAVPRVLDLAPAARFLFLGEGPLESQLRAQVEAAGLVDAVRFLGVRSDIPDVLLASDLFVLPSLWEGLPNVVLEAMAAGLPVVATAVDGTPELVAHGETGWLVPPADPDRLSEAIIHLLRAPATAANLGAAGRRRVMARFSRQANVDAYLTIYRRHLPREDH